MPKEEDWEVQSMGSSIVSAESATKSGDHMRYLNMDKNKLVFYLASPYLIGLLCTALAEIAIMNLAYYYAGIFGLEVQAAVIPIDFLLCRLPVSTMCISVASRMVPFVIRSKAEDLVNYFHHCFIIINAWMFVVCPIIFAPMYKLLYNFANAYNVYMGAKYMLLTLIFNSLFSGYSTAIQALFIVESRNFLSMMREVVLAILLILWLFIVYFISYQNDASEETLTIIPAVSYVIAAGLVSVWMGVVIFRVPVMDIPYKGFATVHIREVFSKLSRHVFGEVFLKAIPYYAMECPPYIGMFVAVYLIGRDYTNADDVTGGKAAIVIFYRLAAFFGFVPTAFACGLNQALSYLMPKKAYLRVRSMMTSAVFYSSVLNVILCVCCFGLSTGVYNFFLPNSLGNQQDYRIMLRYQSLTVRMIGYSALNQLFLGPFRIMINVVQADNNWVFLGITSSMRVISVIASIFYISGQNGDGGYVEIGLFLGEIPTYITGVALLLFYLYKLKYLAKVEEYRHAMKLKQNIQDDEYFEEVVHVDEAFMEANEIMDECLLARNIVSARKGKPSGK